ncbi:MAG: insulinase family protein [Phycisphaeraceae bacterium]|nr:insulinase family protein [Phycisphaeraceae bacterium]
MNEVLQHRFRQGLVLVGQPMRSAQSMAMSLLTPAGAVMEPEDRQGLTAILAEMIMRGAGDMDSRQHADALDALGVVRNTGNGLLHLRLGATFLADRAEESLPLLLDMVRAPRLPEKELEPCRELALQDIAALADEPQQRVFEELGRRHHPMPFGRSTLGRTEGLGRIDLDSVRRFAGDHLVADGAILALAGRFEFDQMVDRIGSMLESWGGATGTASETSPPPRGYQHESTESAQVHIGLAIDAPNLLSDDSMLERYAVGALSGGMSGRLFAEVREKRGLCYAVGARYSADRDRGTILVYAGTRPERAQETLDVTVAELSRLAEGIDADEFDRVRVGLKSTAVMQGESTTARAASMAADQYIYGKPRTLTEIVEEIEEVTLDKVNDYLAHRPARAITMVTIGPKPLNDPSQAEVRVS